MKTKYLIIGAGPTGLGAGYRLKKLGETDFTIIDHSHDDLQKGFGQEVDSMGKPVYYLLGGYTFSY